MLDMADVGGIIVFVDDGEIFESNLMKRNLLIGAVLIAAAALSVGMMAVLPALQKDDEQPRTVKPRTERIVEMPRPKSIESAPNEPIRVANNEKKLPEVKTPIEKKQPEEQKPVVIEPVKTKEPERKKVEPRKVEIKIEPKKDDKNPAAKIIAIGDLVKLNDPAGEFTVQSMGGGKKLALIGVIKTLKIEGLREKAHLDASLLVADEIIFLGDLNSGSKAILGKTHKLTLRDVNEQSLVNASAADARTIRVAGSLNSRSTIKLHAPQGTIEVLGQANENSQLEIDAPDGKVVFKNAGAAINACSKVKIDAPKGHVEFAGQINFGHIDIKAPGGKVLFGIAGVRSMPSRSSRSRRKT